MARGRSLSGGRGSSGVAGLQLALLAAATLLPGALALWPVPEAVTPGSRTLCLARHLSWQAVGYSSDILEAGFERYTAILKAMPLGLGLDEYGRDPHPDDPDLFSKEEEEEEEEEGEGEGEDAAAASAVAGGGAGGALERRRHRKKRRCLLVERVEVSVTSSDQSLTLETRESYSLQLSAPSAAIQANSVYGALRAMETLAQLARRRAVAPPPEPPAGGAGGAAGGGDDGSTLWEEQFPPEALWPAECEDGGERSGGCAAAGAAELGRRRRKTVLLAEETDIYDAPRFRYRGLLLDTARHFLPLSVLKAHLDAMTMVKMNCLHWHLTDDESFPWASEELPELAAKGAFAPEATYTTADIKEVIEYARFRGIRVIPEVDSPGHTRSWGRSNPALLTQCYGKDGQPTGQLGPVNPARNETYGFLWRLVREAARVFPDPYLHLGGDEVHHECWRSNPEVQQFMQEKGFGNDFAKLEGYYMGQVLRLAASAGKAPIVWQEAFDGNDVSLPRSTRVQVWKWWSDAAAQQAQQRPEAQQQAEAEQQAGAAMVRGGGGGDGLSSARRLLVQQQAAQQQEQVQQQLGCDPGLGCGAAPAGQAWKEELQKVTKAGFDAILSAPWYLNTGCYASQDWQQYYAADPHDFQGTTEQKDNVLGGEACAWGEFIDAVNSINRVWPRAAAVAERLWSPKAMTNVTDAARRLADVRCRMLSRGVAAQSMGPGFCPGELTTRM